jgi:imidazolonepropionase-like amidohydrolase/Tol biopolymer transport system component
MIPHGLRHQLLAACIAIGSATPVLAQSSDDWDVGQAFGPTTTVRFETDEGTWMNVDVRPDGRQLVFDLLGDLYLLPVDGGAAQRLTSGPAFDVQPRFSPDGSHLAFTSDRDGNNNIWILEVQTGELRQITEEAERDVNSPAWHPDGDYIFVRKHFVEQRSLGAGEVWMYHVGGGKGLQVTEKNGWQKDAGEPALSPDGRHLYYSKDVTPGQTFEYNKDPYAGIYSVICRDLETGEERTVAGGAGGAITPQVSPDGRLLAFIRRIRYETTLYLRDLDTGEEWALWGGLDRDNQEIWSIHGVYPQYAWSPDGASIVVWGQGKLWRIDAATGEAVHIPFRAEVEQQVHDALRFPHDVAPDQFDVRMLRDVTTAPDGGAVAYSAVGRVYHAQLPNGTPRRLTDDDLIELDPDFSPDGRWIVYTTWSDAERGRVRVARVDGSDARDIVVRPGHYTEPSFSPDGRWVVYRSVAGDTRRGPTHGVHTGIYVVPVEGSGEPVLVRRTGTAPRFDHTGERVSFIMNEDDARVLKSVERSGADERTHFRSENATEIVPSPDGKWIAFVERFNVHLAPFPRSGRAIDLSGDAEGYPVIRVSRDAGAYLHWAGDSRAVHWSVGPEYFTRDVSRTFAFVSGASVEEEPESDGVMIGFRMDADRPEGTVAFVGARVITLSDGTGAGPGGGVIDDATVVVRENRIVAVGPRADTDVPQGAYIVDAAGKTIIPGLVDVHAHVGSESSGILAETSWPLLANLAFGVTTAHDPSNSTEMVFTNAEMIRAGRKLGPRLYSTGTILYGAESTVKAVVDDYDDAVSHIRRMKAVGAISVKSYNQRRRDARQMLLKAAREQEMMVVPEGGALVYANATMVLDGHTGVEHALPVPVVYRDLAELFGRSGTWYTPTLVVAYGGLWGENYWYEHTDVWENARLLRFTPREIVDARSRRRPKAAGEEDYNHIGVARGAKAIQDAGGLAMVGAHGQVQGLGVHWETWMFAQGGMTPVEALRTATINGAAYLGLDGDIGSIEVGKLADLVVLSGDPLEDIRNTETVELVMLNGRLYDAGSLREFGNDTRDAPILWWERRPARAPANDAP